MPKSSSLLLNHSPVFSTVLNLAKRTPHITSIKDQRVKLPPSPSSSSLVALHRRITKRTTQPNSTMTVTEYDKGDEPEIVVNAEPDANMVTAVGVEEVKKPGGTGPSIPIPAGHSRFYCSKCRTVSHMRCPVSFVVLGILGNVCCGRGE